MTTPRLIKRYRKGNYSLYAMLVCICAIAITFTNCKTTKKVKKDKKAPVAAVIPSAPAVPAPPPAGGNVPNTLADLLQPLLHKQWNYNTFSGKAKMRYGNMEFTANFRVKKGQAIWIAATAFGGMVQVARIYVTPDSVRIVNYLQKEALLMSINQAASLVPVPVDFNSLQNLVVGEPLGTDGTLTNATDFGDTWTAQVEDVNYIRQLTYNKADTSLRMEQLSARNGTGSQGSIRYDEYKYIRNVKYPEHRSLSFQNGSQQYDIDMNFNTVEFDVPVDMPFSVPKGYSVK